MAAPEGGAESLSILELIATASLPAQGVMLILLLASLVSWYLIDRKRHSFRHLTHLADLFEEQFWAGGEMHAIYREWQHQREPEGIVTLFVAGYDEYHRLHKTPGISRTDVVEGVQRYMRVALNREIEHLESHLTFLATVGSTSPYVGLFGTVWGIMNAFRELGVAEQATIAAVAPGIAEALIATAMGLLAAIPAVIAYNQFANSAERLGNRYQMFIEEFLSIVNRQNMGMSQGQTQTQTQGQSQGQSHPTEVEPQ